MDGNEGIGGKTPNPEKRKRLDMGTDASPGSGDEESSFLPYLKPNYKRLYPENSTQVEFKVFVQGLRSEKIGNKSPIYLNHIFSSSPEIKGVASIHRVNANKIVLIFKQYNTANNFLNNTDFLQRHNIKAFIPAAQIEKTGIIRFVPANISNKDLYTKLSSRFEIIAIRRFIKKVNNQRVPLQTVSITFLSNVLPDTVQYDLFSYRVFDYVPPLQQCYRCLKFNHSAKICNGKQRCSCCGGEHIYRECDRPNDLCCANCSGPHLAISKLCPIKMKKIEEKKNKITYATVANTKKVTNDFDFPPLPMTNKPAKSMHKPSLVNHVNTSVNNVNTSVNSVNTSSSVQNVNKPSPSKLEDIKKQLLNDKELTAAIIRTLVDLANKRDDSPITTASIQDMLFKNLK
ncbi:hypothetical protein K1T71_005583 [Dendrolimus kikuchii]|uniref:Uncharacterized protein n=4 Tax=Dendrolimus kikuchii TaxID=765133 RepID=A0ACC1D2Y8_9NEOP|nr:hypothetical protein K1T71_015047 [Dendrolimus kikuchii]KAJ0176486.1 hypothetical protein K1T71_007665 [Dendrolimus kikuchii]KAJ0177333.1 hypothetical protein K1T71_007342 [Dendrolimus kikuchii]KAJ0178176.1 hypothetical protein K1T71_005999 [Dendrolimus kikuchii]KAJ0178808.1 hypothetical protein K1T71_005583 [Dendrolimus kikuchii]